MILTIYRFSTFQSVSVLDFDLPRLLQGLYIDQYRVLGYSIYDFLLIFNNNV